LKFRLSVFSALLATMALAACGSDSKSEEESEAAATPAEAVERIGNVRSGLDEAVAKYKTGDEKAADRIVGDTYLEEFEHVEGPLEKVNHELNEELEDGIREELRDKIKKGESVQEVETYVSDLKTKLDQAEAALQ
jgi:outer membrane murein-binding lipoprotein Lpp